MSDIPPFIALGFRHITDLAAMDHLLFLVALAAIYRGRDWWDAIWVVSAFTLGHSITLALAVTGRLALPMPLIEFLIPLTIVATGVENMVAWTRRYRPVLAGTFGLVHGAGFASYLRELFEGPIAGPLFGFNLGIEIGQVLVLALAGLALAGVDGILGLAPVRRQSALRLRTLGVSAAVVVVAARMAAERVPW